MSPFVFISWEFDNRNRAKVRTRSWPELGKFLIKCFPNLSLTFLGTSFMYITDFLQRTRNNGLLMTKMLLSTSANGCVQVYMMGNNNSELLYLVVSSFLQKRTMLPLTSSSSSFCPFSSGDNDFVESIKFFKKPFSSVWTEWILHQTLLSKYRKMVI